MMDQIVTEKRDAARDHPPILIGSPAPRFIARTTMGERSLDGYRGRWLVLFSHPADFTPVCTSEFVSFSKAYPKFQNLDCDLLALSVDSLFSHVAWVRSIRDRFKVTVPFPIAEDPSMAIAEAYGMIHPGAADSSTVRATFVIDPDGLVRALIWYPMSTGRRVDEIIRLVSALQVTDSAAVSTPEGWMPGDDVIDAAPLSVEASDTPGGGRDHDWYYRVRKL
jgi:peroxiredoxin (alkyl hydroperoxide reductase subunit C)